MTRPDGFSLPELLVAMAIADILSGIGFALYQRQWQGERTKAAACNVAAGQFRLALDLRRDLPPVIYYLQPGHQRRRHLQRHPRARAAA